MSVQVDQQGDRAAVHVECLAPAVIIVLEAEAEPRVIGSNEPEAVRRLMLSLSDEWQDLLLAALQTIQTQDDDD